METLDEKIEEAYESWRSTWELDGMTIRDIYEAGYRHAIEDIEDETPNVQGQGDGERSSSISPATRG